MDDRKLLELAAKAAGIELQRSRLDDPMCKDFLLVRRAEDDNGVGWNPLDDDGDALRLAIDLQIQFGIVLEDSRGWAESHAAYFEFQWDMHRQSERYEATRRAIVRAAAVIGKEMP